MNTELKINPKILQWAREECGYSPDEIDDSKTSFCNYTVPIIIETGIHGLPGSKSPSPANWIQIIFYP